MLLVLVLRSSLLLCRKILLLDNHTICLFSFSPSKKILMLQKSIFLNIAQDSNLGDWRQKGRLWGSEIRCLELEERQNTTNN